jgi:hypothetical protein
MENFAGRILSYYRNLDFKETLPEGVRVLNPFTGDRQIRGIMEQFYGKYYSDNHPRTLILGINPGRFGGGATGIPFTDTKRLRTACGIDAPLRETHEPSSVFVYRVIEAFGGAERFYGEFYINSVFPLALVKTSPNGRTVNMNYYDSPGLAKIITPFILRNIRQQIELGVETGVCYCLGTGKNLEFLLGLNAKYSFFRNIIPLEHPRFIVQYKARNQSEYIEKYLRCLRNKSC